MSENLSIPISEVPIMKDPDEKKNYTFITTGDNYTNPFYECLHWMDYNKSKTNITLQKNEDSLHK